MRLAVLLVGCLVTPGQVQAAKADDIFRLGFSYSMLAGVNENDARASLRAIATVVSRDRGIHANPEPLLFKGLESAITAVRTGEVDAISIAADEYWALANRISFGRFILAGADGNPHEEYVLLVRKDSGLTDLASLRGKHLAFLAAPRMRLGNLWIDVLLARADLPSATAFFARTTKAPKPAKAVLDVFFKQADACLVTRQGFAAMAELNPQVGRQLVPLAVSPPLVPALFAFRSGLAPDYEDRIVREFMSAQRTAAGRQALTIFQVGDLSEHPGAALKSAVDLLDEYRRLRPEDAARLVARLDRGTVGPMEEEAR